MAQCPPPARPKYATAHSQWSLRFIFTLTVSRPEVGAGKIGNIFPKQTR